MAVPVVREDEVYIPLNPPSKGDRTVARPEESGAHYTGSRIEQSNRQVQEFAGREYKFGWVTPIESDTLPQGLDEDVIKVIWEKKGEPDWMLDWRLKAYRQWLTMEEPTWANICHPPIDYQKQRYYSAPKTSGPGPKSLDDVDKELLATFEKLGVPLEEQKQLAGVAVDAVFDSVSVATTHKDILAKRGIIFCSYTEALHEYPDLVKRYLGSVVPINDNFFSALNSAVFSDGSFCYIPKGVQCPMDLSTYFRINAAETGQFERTLIIAEEGASVSYLEGCTAPIRDEKQLHAAVVELVALDNAMINYSTVQNWYADDVKCTHGATVGQPPDEIVFYFRTRGIDPVTARRILTLGFVREIVARISVPAHRDRLDTVLSAHYSPLH